MTRRDGPFRLMKLPLPCLLLGLFGALDAARAGVRPVILPLVYEDDLLPGVGEVTSFADMAVNSVGQWTLIVDTNGPSGADGALLSNGVIFAREGQPVTQPNGAFIGAFLGLSLDISQRRLSWLTLVGPPSHQDSGLYLDSQLLLREGDTVAAPGFSAGTNYVGFLEAKLSDARQILLVASVDDPAIASSVDRAMMRLHVSSGGALVSVQPLIKEGDVPSGAGAAVLDIAFGPHQSAINSAGATIYRVQLDAASDRDQALYLNGNPIAREGDDSPVAGRVYENLNNRAVALGEEGVFAFKADLSGGTSSDYAIIRDGVLYRQEGSSAAPIAPFAFTGSNAFGPADGPLYVDRYGSILHYGEWDDPQSNRDSGLLLGDALIVAEGVTVIDDEVVDAIDSGPFAFALSPNGRFLVFRATLADGRQGVFWAELRRCPDVDSDGLVGLTDLATALSKFATCVGEIDEFPATLDVDYSGCIDLSDLAHIFSLYGQPCDD